MVVDKVVLPGNDSLSAPECISSGSVLSLPAIMVKMENAAPSLHSCVTLWVLRKSRLIGNNSKKEAAGTEGAEGTTPGPVTDTGLGKCLTMLAPPPTHPSSSLGICFKPI